MNTLEKYRATAAKASVSRAALSAAIVKTGLTAEQFNVLAVIVAKPGLPTATVAQRAKMLGPSVSRILEALRTKKLITSVPKDGDAREFRQHPAVKAAALVASVVL